MSPRHVVVDGSNIATEGHNLPSLAQLDQAVREFLAENPDDVVTVVVDASFGHRIDPSELKTFEEAEAAAEVVSPPAGAIGRGDAFLLRIAEKTGATVLSNDSFQEFHGEHEWLFEKGRLIGGKPVPGVGWIFTPRTPVRGPKSREAVKEAKRRRRGGEVAEGVTGLDLAASRGGRGKRVERAIATATVEATGSNEGTRRRRRRGGEPPADPVNAPLAFINFIAAHRLGSTVEGTVESFSSHGAFVTVEGTTCYLPLSAMADPPPTRAREVVQKGDTRPFVVQAFDPLRRGVELAVPGFEHVAAGVTDETVEAEISPRVEEEVAATDGAGSGPRRNRRRSRAGAAAAAPEATAPAEAAGLEQPATAELGQAEPPAPAKRASRRAPAAKKAAALPEAASPEAARPGTPSTGAPSAEPAAAEAGARAPRRRGGRKAPETTVPETTAPETGAAEPAAAPAPTAKAATRATASRRKAAAPATPGEPQPPAREAEVPPARRAAAAAKSGAARAAASMAPAASKVPAASTAPA
ncbi:MAG TPA: S1 RNA-binding domain-containing protein, partial [Acidimicrobiales bacterium]|nr:S1 RNA-binding domain-containing protein [Acidimicrobiales bacterium]